MVMVNNYRAWNPAGYCGGPTPEASNLTEGGHITSQTEQNSDVRREQPNPYSVIFKRLLVRITDIQKNHLKYQKVPFIPGIVSVKNSKHF